MAEACTEEEGAEPKVPSKDLEAQVELPAPKAEVEEAPTWTTGTQTCQEFVHIPPEGRVEVTLWVKDFQGDGLMDTWRFSVSP